MRHAVLIAVGLCAWAPALAAQAGNCQPAQTAHRAGQLQAGHYELTLIGLTRWGTDSAARGQLVLRPTPTAWAGDSASGTWEPLQGWTTLPLAQLGPIQVATPPDSRDSTNPGVRVRVRPTGAVDLWFGIGPYGSVALDAGLLLHVLELNAEGFRGRWEDGGNTLRHASGFFCAWYQ